MEADRPEPVHHRRAGEGLGEEEHVGIGAAHLADQPLPERERLGVRVVDAEDPHPVGHPVLDDPQHLAADAGGVVVEVDRVDVLVLLRRVLGVGDGPVRAGGEELRVLGDPRVVRRRLEGQVEGDLEADLLRAGDEGVEVLDGAEVGVDGVVAAVARADRPGGAGVLGAGGQGVVGALAVDLADRVDGRQVDHVEAHRRDRRQALGGGAEGPGGDPPGLGVEGRALGAGEELVPAAEQREAAIGERAERALDGDEVAQRVVQHDLPEVLGLQLCQPGRRGAAAVGGGLEGALDERALVLVGAGAELVALTLEQQPGLGEHQVDVDAGRHLDPGVVLPGRPRVGPPLHLEGPRALGVRRHPGLVAVRGVGELGHPHRRPTGAVRRGEDDLSREAVVALAENRGADGEGLADRRLRGLTSEVHDRRDVHDGDATDHPATLAARGHPPQPGSLAPTGERGVPGGPRRRRRAYPCLHLSGES